MVAPYGLKIDEGTHYVEVTPNSAKASVVKQDNTKFQTDGDATWFPLALTTSACPSLWWPRNGKPANYTVTVVKPIPFASFSMEGERHESQISRVTEEPDFQVTGLTTKRPPWSCTLLQVRRQVHPHLRDQLRREGCCGRH